ncbi:MAG: hypothetical protein L0216_10215 [Planctomycetales bacterium]|nr:hypothetical protein [Planctomycetales bacterium]
MRLHRTGPGRHGRGGELPFLMALTVLAAVAILGSPGSDDFPFVAGVAAALLGLYALAISGRGHRRPGQEVRR